MNKNNQITWPNIPEWDKVISCRDPSHGFPTHLWIPPGQTHVHKCPSCDQETQVTAPEIIY